MPDHCTPRNFEFERERLWGGGAVMQDSERPLSFVVRGAMPGRSPPDEPVEPDESTSTTEEDASEGPRGLPPPRRKTPPIRRYRKKMPGSEIDPATIPPHHIVVVGGNTFWLKDGMTPSAMPSGPTNVICMPARKYALAVPVPGLTKRVPGRSVPTKGSAVGTERRHCCPVESCQKMFKKRDHMNRHVKCLHQDQKTWVCYRPECDRAFTRYDNYDRHLRKHSHWQEIAVCSPEDGFKGIHIPNPLVLDPSSAQIKPFKQMGIHPSAMDLWRFQEGRRRQGFYVPGGDLTECERYFVAHPEEREPAFRGEGIWHGLIPAHGPEFKPYPGGRSSCLTGVFKVNVPQDSDDA